MYSTIQKAISATYGGMQKVSIKVDQACGEKQILDTVKMETSFRLNFDFLFVLDISASTDSIKPLEVLRAILIFFDVLKDDDIINILLFNDSCFEVLKAMKKKDIIERGGLAVLIFDKYLARVKDATKTNGYSALWESIILGLKQVATREVRTNSQPHVIVLSNGQNTENRPHKKKICTAAFLEPGNKIFMEMLHQANGSAFAHFHCTCISVGNEAAANFNDIHSKNVFHFHAKDTDGIAKCFQEVKQFIDDTRLPTHIW